MSKPKKPTRIKSDAVTVFTKVDPKKGIDRGGEGEKFVFTKVREVFMYLWTLGLRTPKSATRDSFRTFIPCFIGGYNRPPDSPNRIGFAKGTDLLSSLLVLDFDEDQDGRRGATLTLDEIAEKLKNLETIVYTTRSHSLDEFHYRILVRLSRAVSAKEYKDLTKAISDKLGGGVHTKSINAFNDCPPHSCEFRETLGDPLFVDSELGLQGLQQGTSSQLETEDNSNGVDYENEEVEGISSPVQHHPRPGDVLDHFMNLLSTQTDLFKNTLRDGHRNEITNRVGFTLGGAFQALEESGENPFTEDQIVPMFCGYLGDRNDHIRTFKTSFTEGRQNPLKDLGSCSPHYSSLQKLLERKMQDFLLQKKTTTVSGGLHSDEVLGQAAARNARLLANKKELNIKLSKITKQKDKRKT